MVIKCDTEWPSELKTGILYNLCKLAENEIDAVVMNQVMVDG